MGIHPKCPEAARRAKRLVMGMGRHLVIGMGRCSPVMAIHPRYPEAARRAKRLVRGKRGRGRRERLVMGRGRGPPVMAINPRCLEATRRAKRLAEVEWAAQRAVHGRERKWHTRRDRLGEQWRSRVWGRGRCPTPGSEG